MTGATASGKSAHALSIAEKNNGVIINADSQQLYRELPILTARPTADEEVRVPHRLYGVMGAETRCSAGMWLKLAIMEIDWARSQGMLPIVVGGTGLYLKALMQGIADIPDIDEAVRIQSENDYTHMGKDAFIERLKAVDPDFFKRLSVYDKQRLVRAYAVWLGTGKSLSYWQQREVKPAYPDAAIELIQIDIPREELYRRCDARFLHMVDQGAVEEVKQLVALKLPNDLPLMKSVGVKEITSYLNKEITLEDAISQAQQATRNYAKRQLTWLRHQM